MAYKTMDWRGRVPGSPVSNIGTRKKDLGVVIHYSGPATALGAGRTSVFDQVATEIRYQLTPGLYSPGFTVNGYMYHAVVWEDTLYLIRNWDAALWHAADYNHNMRSYSIHVPIGEGQRASSRTIQTLTEVTDDLLKGIGKGRGWCLGHKEISATACPGSLMADFVVPYRTGKLKPAPSPGSPAVKLPSYPRLVVMCADTAWTRPRVAFLSDLSDNVAVETNPERVEAYSQVVYDSQPVGARMLLALGKKSRPMLSADARSVLGKYGAGVSDVRRGFSDEEVIAELRTMQARTLVPKGSVAKYRKRFVSSGKDEDDRRGERPEKPAPKPPAPASGKAAIIDRYFASTYHSFGAYSPVGEIIIEEAKRADLALQAACALVEQESGGRNIFGCDHGPRGDSPPYCRQPVTKERVAALRRSGMMNGVGLTQLTWHTFVTDAENLGGAHLVRNQLRIGFALLASYFAKYGEQDGYGSYNAGEGNRASVRGSYSASCIAKSRAWRQRLG